MLRHHRLDNPGTNPKEDAFNRAPFSKRLADTIAAFDTTNGAPIFGIFGKWGYGKSTVLNYIKRELATGYPDKVIVYEFNPWLFKGQDELLTQFFLGLAACMEQSIGNPIKETGQLLQKYSGLFGMLPIIGTGASKLAEQLGRELSLETLPATRGRIFEMMRNASQVVVVLIDDLDRLDHEEILLMLKLVRLNANFPHVVYVLAFDDDVVARAAATKYGIGEVAGRQFLEKIVQYPYTLPAVGHDRLVAFATERVRDSCSSAGVDLASADWLRFRRIIDHNLSLRLSTPRQAIRYGNALGFSLPMLKGHANAFEQILIEGLRLLFPELYKLIRDDVASFTKLVDDNSFREVVSDNLNKIARQEMADASESEVEAGISIVTELFSRSGRADSIAHVHYFERYFSYAMEPGDILDAELELIREQIGSRRDGFNVYNDEEATASLRRLAVSSPARLIDALYPLAAKLGAQGSSVVAQALARIGNLFTPDREILLWKTPLSIECELAFRVRTLIARLISEVPFHAGRRERAIGNVISNAQPLSFAILLRRQLLDLIINEKFLETAGVDDRAMLKETITKQINETIARRIREFAEQFQSALFEKQTAGPYLLAEWNSLEPEIQRTWVNDRLFGSPSDALAIGDLFTSAPFEEYNISSIVRPDVLTDALSRLDNLIYEPGSVQRDHIREQRTKIADMMNFIASHQALRTR